ncbi:MAG: Protein kinase, partial [Polyangiaceae bacterium]|nr:Protein kinase [Polyangiaceae bacterium]
HAALDLAREAAQLLEAGAPSLLNEAPVFLAYHDAAMDVGDEELAKAAIAQAVPLAQRRLLGLSGTPYAKLYLTELPHNTRLLALAEELGVVPDAIHRALESGN